MFRNQQQKKLGKFRKQKSEVQKLDILNKQSLVLQLRKKNKMGKPKIGPEKVNYGNEF